MPMGRGLCRRRPQCRGRGEGTLDPSRSLCYRLSRIAGLTGRDPRKPADLIDLIAVARLMGALDPSHSLRCRLSRIAGLTGRDPRKPADLIDLIAAARLMSAPSSPAPAQLP